MADVKLPNISQSNLNINGTAAGNHNSNTMGGDNMMYNDSMAGQPRNGGRSQSFHSGRAGGAGTGSNGFGQVGRSIMEAKK